MKELASPNLFDKVSINELLISSVSDDLKNRKIIKKKAKIISKKL